MGPGSTRWRSCKQACSRTPKRCDRLVNNFVFSLSDDVSKNVLTYVSIEFGYNVRTLWAAFSDVYSHLFSHTFSDSVLGGFGRLRGSRKPSPHSAPTQLKISSKSSLALKTIRKQVWTYFGIDLGSMWGHWGSILGRLRGSKVNGYQMQNSSTATIKWQ